MPSATLVFTQQSNDESDFEVQRKTMPAGSFAFLTTVAANATPAPSLITFQDLSVLAGTTYVYRVRANNGSLHSAWSNEATISIGGTPPPPPPPDPTDLGGYRPQMPPVYGMGGVFGRGSGGVPVIYNVNTLNPNAGAASVGGTGTTSDPFVFTAGLKTACEASGPRFVIFSVSGYIDNTDTIRVVNPYLTVAFQTAPGPISIRKYGFEIQTNQVIFQHGGVRVGEWGQGKADNCGIICFGTDCHDIVLDHMSVTWGPDENIAADTYYAGDMNMSIWRCLSAEGLDFPTSVPLSASHGVLVQAKSKNVALIQSLMATNRERNPYCQSDTSLVAINNVLYNWFANWAFFFANFQINGDPGGGGWRASVVNNWLIPGPNTDDDSGSPNGWLFYYDETGASPTSNRIYRSGNINDPTLGIPITEEGNELPYNPNTGTPPVALPGITILSAGPSLETFILAACGARPLDRDPVDTRIINDVIGRTAPGYINHQGAVGGYPTLTSGSTTLTLPANPFVVADAFGRTNLELWLEDFAIALEAV